MGHGNRSHSGDLAAQLYEGITQIGCQALAQCTLAGSTQSNERNSGALGTTRPMIVEQLAQRLARAPQIRLPPPLQELPDHQPLRGGCGDISQKLGQFAVQCVGYLKQHQYRHVTGPVFKVRQMAFGHFRRFGNGFARHSTSHP